MVAAKDNVKWADRRLRIYYESIEQALHLIVPLLEAALKKQGAEILIELVRGNWPSNKGEGPIDSFRLLNTPDAVVTVILSEEKREFPLFVLEFSEAVKTEDHELQRATVAAASMWTRIPAIKISGERESTLDHGGNKGFSPFAMAKLFQDFGGVNSYFYQEWPSANGKLLTQEEALSCPPLDKVPVLLAVVEAACTVAASPILRTLAANEVCLKVVSIADTLPAVKEYRASVRAATADDGGLVNCVIDPKPVKVLPGVLVKNRATVADDRTLYVKLNRFDHAGDPDRGVLIALSTGWAHKVMTLYRIEDRGKTKNKPALRSIFDSAASVVDAFAGYAREEGMQRWFCDLVRRNARQGATLDLSTAIEEHKSDIERSTLFRAIFLFSDGFLVQLARKGSVDWLILEWDRQLAKRLFGPVKPGVAQQPRRIVPAETADEDEVTYVVVHRVLRPNRFKILCISYPGHQAGGAILHGEESGRIRTRTYADIVAVAPSKPATPSLTEAKETLGSGIDADIKKLVMVREDRGLRNGIQALLQGKGIGGWEGKEVFLSIAFGGAQPARWSPTGIDFLVRLNGRGKYSVAPFGNAKRLFEVTVEGESRLPKVWTQA